MSASCETVFEDDFATRVASLSDLSAAIRGISEAESDVTISPATHALVVLLTTDPIELAAVRSMFSASERGKKLMKTLSGYIAGDFIQLLKAELEKSPMNIEAVREYLSACDSWVAVFNCVDKWYAVHHDETDAERSMRQMVYRNLHEVFDTVVDGKRGLPEFIKCNCANELMHFKVSNRTFALDWSELEGGRFGFLHSLLRLHVSNMERFEFVITMITKSIEHQPVLTLDDCSSLSAILSANGTILGGRIYDIVVRIGEAGGKVSVETWVQLMTQHLAKDKIFRHVYKHRDDVIFNMYNIPEHNAKFACDMIKANTTRFPELRSRFIDFVESHDFTEDGVLEIVKEMYTKTCEENLENVAFLKKPFQKLTDALDASARVRVFTNSLDWDRKTHVLVFSIFKTMAVVKLALSMDVPDDVKVQYLTEYIDSCGTPRIHKYLWKLLAVELHSLRDELMAGAAAGGGGGGCGSSRTDG